MNPKKHANEDDRATAEEVVALALNEQGFLFQQKVLDTLDGAQESAWMVRATEYPVAFGARGEYNTKIDIVLGSRTTTRDPWHLIVECKRANRDYKRWVFFDQNVRLTGITRRSMFVQRADLSGGWDQQKDAFPPLFQRVEKIYAHQDCPMFNFYIEARINRPNSGQKSSATEAIEESLRQVCTGMIGMGVELTKMKALSFRLLPIVVTSADLFSAEFESANVSIDRGQIAAEKLKLRPQKWLGVNYRIDNLAAQFAGLTTNTPTSVHESLWVRYLRTVFVVQAEHLIPFLGWASHWITDTE